MMPKKPSPFIRFLSPSWAPIFLLALIGTSELRAAPAPALLLESAGGRFVLLELSSGREVARRILGGATPGVEALKTALSDPRMSAATKALWTRLRHVELRFAERYPGAASTLYTADWNASALSPAQRDWLDRIVREELDRSFVETLPAAPVQPLRASEATAAQIRAASESAMSQVPETPAVRISRWRRQYESSRDQVRELARTTRGAHLKASAAFEGLRRSSPEIDSILNPEFVREVLADSGSKSLAARAETVFLAVKGDASSDPLSTKLTRALQTSLAGEVPSDSIASRIDGLRTASSVRSFRRALGELTLDESRRLLIGVRGLQPSKESLVGQYLAQTGASSVVRRFPVAPDSNEPGPERLVVAVDAKTFPVFKQLIAKRETYFGQLHTPLQGTLIVEHAGRAGTYGSPDESLRMPTQGSMLPLVVLSTSEGGRMTRYFDLGNAARSGGLAGEGGDYWSFSDTALKPWKLEGYCATGAYASCTHWIANIPIGDRMVTEYGFPGWVDHDPYTPEEVRGPRTPEPRIALLEPFDVDSAGAIARELIQDVWSVPGHQQLADVLGVTAQAYAAELTNPGWVAITMTARVPQQRLPVVFLFVADASSPIDPGFDPQFSAR